MLEEVIESFVSKKDRFKDKHLLLLGKSGCGKTYSVEKVGKEREIPVYKFVLSNINMEDICGTELPNRETKEMEIFPPQWYTDVKSLLKNNPRLILFLDELTTAHPVVQGKILTLLQDGSLGQLKLDLDKLIIIGAGNLQEELDGFQDLIHPLKNRFFIHKVTHTPKEIQSMFPDINPILLSNFIQLNKKFDSGEKLQNGFKISLSFRDLTFFQELYQEFGVPKMRKFLLTSYIDGEEFVDSLLSNIITSEGDTVSENVEELYEDIVKRIYTLEFKPDQDALKQLGLKISYLISKNFQYSEKVQEVIQGSNLNHKSKKFLRESLS